MDDSHNEPTRARPWYGWNRKRKHDRDTLIYAHMRPTGKHAQLATGRRPSRVVWRIIRPGITSAQLSRNAVARMLGQVYLISKISIQVMPAGRRGPYGPWDVCGANFDVFVTPMAIFGIDKLSSQWSCRSAKVATWPTSHLRLPAPRLICFRGPCGLLLDMNPYPYT